MRSQLFVTDLIFTMSVFMIFFTLIVYSFNVALIEQPIKLHKTNAKLVAEELASLIVLNPGYPVDWDNSTIIYPGIVYQEDELDWDKMNMLLAMDDLNSSDKLYLPFTISFILENSTYVNCSQHLQTKYGACSFTDEPKATRLVENNGEVYRLWVVVE